VLKTVKGGRVAIDVNGERGVFFRSHKGLRQGDPLSPLLFNLVGDAFSAMLRLACRRGELEGLVPHLVENRLSHLQYADDTVIFLRNTQVSKRNLKFILFCYEAMSGMKINYEKSEVLVVGIEQSEHQQIADFFGCKMGVWPMTYLGIPVSVNKITKAQLNFVVDKAKRCLGTWKCETLSSGGKAVLLNSCLSSIPMYTMGVYILYEGNYQALDSVRKKFFWQGTNKKRKYHMVTWETDQTKTIWWCWLPGYQGNEHMLDGQMD